MPTAQPTREPAPQPAAQQPADSQQAKPADPDGAIFSWGPSPTISSPDGRFEIRVRGRVLADFGYVDDNLDLQDRFATELRRARLGVQGKAWKDIKYKLEVDFADEDVSANDIYLQYTGWDGLKLTVGYFKEQISLEEITSSNQTSLMERAAFTDAYSIGRRIGVGLNFSHGDFGGDLGVYSGADLDQDRDNEGFALTARAYFEPEFGNGGKLHAGGFIRYRDLDNSEAANRVRYRQRPFSHVSGLRYVNTDLLQNLNSDILAGAELAGTMGPFWAAAEYAWSRADVVSGFEPVYFGDGSINTSGGYFDIGWFITGESRPLGGGTFGRPKVTNPVFEGGSGAFALAARVDYLDLTDRAAGVYGGEQISYIVGLTWYLNRHVRVLLNYAHTDVTDGLCGAGCRFGDAVTDEFGKASIDAVTGRVQVDW